MVSNMTPTARAAYLAGLFDGEGCVGVYGDKGYTLTVQLVQNANIASSPVFNYLKDQFGGSVNLRKPKKRELLNWYICGDQAKNFLEYILPYTLFKREQILTAVTWHNTRAPREKNTNGRFRPNPEQRVRDERVAKVLREMKRV